MTERKINIKPADLKKEMESAYLDYSMSVIVSRALPDVRDGLKPVHNKGCSQIENTPSLQDL